MTTFAWCTDIHLDFIDDDQRLVRFAEQLIVNNPTGIIISGDISVAHRLVYHLSVLERVVQRPIYYVLGNHDYYGSNVEDVRKSMKELSNISPFLKYLPTTPYVSATPTTAILGHDGWYDAGYGDWQNSNVSMSDWTAIHDFIPTNTNKGGIVALARKLAHEGVTHVHNAIKAAVRYHKRIIVVTHYPPFEESHTFEGRQGHRFYQPWFTSKLMGDVMLDAAKAFPSVHFSVLAGHTHGAYDGQPMPNLSVHVGHADYRTPVLQRLINVP